MLRLTVSQARRAALAAQGLGGARRGAAGGRPALDRLLAATGLLQIDSVTVLARAHYLPGWSRLGSYPRERLDAYAYRDRALFEYWGHEASLLPVSLHPLLRWRMRRAEQRFETWGGPARIAREHPAYVAAVLAEVAARGPTTAADLETDQRRRGSWWDWSRPKAALEWLAWTGQLAVADRRGFTRRYDLADRVLPAAVLALPTPEEPAALRELLALAARRHGVGTAADLADYFRIPPALARPRFTELVEEGRLQPAAVDGWRAPAYAAPDLVVPRRVGGAALLAPFDPLVWERARTERLFGFRYRLELYTPAARRVHGYYVLPFLLGDRLVARVDLKADRTARLLLVRAAWAEHTAPQHTAVALAAELVAMSAWLGLGEVVVAGRGDLAERLAGALVRPG